MPVFSFAHHAMATRFEMVLIGDQESYLRAVADEAFAEIDRVETQISYYRADSDLTDLNCNAAQGPVRVDPRFFRLLAQARALSEQTDGAFDPTVGPLLRVWGLTGDPRTRPPTEEELAAARALVGFHNVCMDPESFTVSYRQEGVSIDLGGIGKGYAIDRVVDLIRAAGIGSGLIHGGTSSVFAIGSPQDGIADCGLRIAIAAPPSMPASGRLGIVSLQDCALSVSGQHGKAIMLGDTLVGHTLDPRTGRPVSREMGGLLAAVICDTATEAEALSTALLTLGSAGFDHESLRDRGRMLVTKGEKGDYFVRRAGALDEGGGTMVRSVGEDGGTYPSSW